MGRHEEPFYFYPRSPCGERRLPTALRTPHHKFLSTLSLRRATSNIIDSNSNFTQFLSTLSLRRATTTQDDKHAQPPISIHALLAESDGPSFCGLPSNAGISIHALLAESDAFWFSVVLKAPEISIHALLAESDFSAGRESDRAEKFLSTLSLRRATQAKSLKIPPLCISIHALLAESDQSIELL